MSSKCMLVNNTTNSIHIMIVYDGAKYSTAITIDPSCAYDILPLIGDANKYKEIPYLNNLIHNGVISVKII